MLICHLRKRIRAIFLHIQHALNNEVSDTEQIHKSLPGGSLASNPPMQPYTICLYVKMMMMFFICVVCFLSWTISRYNLYDRMLTLMLTGNVLNAL